MPPKRSRSKPGWQLDIARERIDILFKQAEKMFKEDPKLSDRYVEIARKIGMKFNVPIPAKYKRRVCRKCRHFLVFGRNARQRVSSEKKYVLITCLDCGERHRIPYVRELKAKKAGKK